jgi:hypothetical protein
MYNLTRIILQQLPTKLNLDLTHTQLIFGTHANLEVFEFLPVVFK